MTDVLTTSGLKLEYLSFTLRQLRQAPALSNSAAWGGGRRGVQHTTDNHL